MLGRLIVVPDEAAQVTLPVPGVEEPECALRKEKRATGGELGGGGSGRIGRIHERIETFDGAAREKSLQRIARLFPSFSPLLVCAGNAITGAGRLWEHPFLTCGQPFITAGCRIRVRQYFRRAHCHAAILALARVAELTAAELHDGCRQCGPCGQPYRHTQSRSSTDESPGTLTVPKRRRLVGRQQP